MGLVMVWEFCVLVVQCVGCVVCLGLGVVVCCLCVQDWVGMNVDFIFEVDYVDFVVFLLFLVVWGFFCGEGMVLLILLLQDWVVVVEEEL